MMLLAVTLIAVAAGQDPDIVYKYTDAYELIWNDVGSGGDSDGSVWRARNYQSDFCALGDAATSGYGAPTFKAVLVSQRKSGALVNPTSFTQVWKDAGSGADRDGAFYKMNAPSGYICLGGVAMNSHNTEPDPKKYCCVKREYVVQADTMETWNDRGSGADKDVSLWTVIRAGGDALGIDSGNFIAVAGYSRPASTAAYLLKADGNKVVDVWSLSTSDKKPLNLNEIGELKFIWNDAGSGANADVSIWRAEARNGYYPVGDIVVATHSKPKIGFLLRPSNPDGDAVAAPVSYSRIWNDAGSGANRDVQLWKVNCPGGYVSLGGVATDGSYPKLGDVYCVKHSYTTYGSSNNWGYTWKDSGSGANRDVTIYEARGTSSNQQSVRGFGAVSSYSYRPSSPYFLNTDFVSYWAEKPIEKIFMYNVQYDLSKEKQQTAPSKMSPTVMVNPTGRTVKASRTLTYTVAESSTFTFSQAIAIGIAVEFTAGIPLISHKTTVSVTATSTFTTGQTTTKTHSDSITAFIELPPKSQSTAVITGTEYKADIPYTATIKKVYYDGSFGYATISGVYKGVAISERTVTYGKIEPYQE